MPRGFLASLSLSVPSSLLWASRLFAVPARCAAFASASLVAAVAMLAVTVHLRFASWRPPPCAPVAPVSAKCVASSSATVALLRRRPLAVCSSRMMTLLVCTHRYMYTGHFFQVCTWLHAKVDFRKRSVESTHKVPTSQTTKRNKRTFRDPYIKYICNPNESTKTHRSPRVLYM